MALYSITKDGAEPQTVREVNSLCPAKGERMMRELEVQTGNFGEGDAMSTEGTAKSKESTESTESKAAEKVAENMESEMEVRDEGRQEEDRAEQQDLNQGMD